MNTGVDKWEHIASLCSSIGQQQQRWPSEIGPGNFAGCPGSKPVASLVIPLR